MLARLLTRSLLLCCIAFIVCPELLNAQTIYWKKDYITDGSGATIAVASPQPTDTMAPSTPGNLSTSSTTTTTVTFSWTESDTTGVAGFVIYRGAIPVGAVAYTSTTLPTE